MRGSPPLIAVLTLGFFVLLLAPLRHLTSARTAEATVGPTPETSGEAAVAPSAVRLEIAATRVPFTFEVRHLGRVVWTGELTEGAPRAEHAGAMEFPAEGMDLQLRGRWTADAGGPSSPLALAAVRLTVTPPDGTAHVKTVMAEGGAALDETLTFP